jgi:hypothetical protein
MKYIQAVPDALKLVLAWIVVFASFPVLADDHDWNQHEANAYRAWHGPHYVLGGSVNPVPVAPAPVYPAPVYYGRPKLGGVNNPPNVVYAPPVVYEAPPPAQSTGMTLVMPMAVQ